MFFQSFWVSGLSRNWVDLGSDLNISTEDGSRGASPPFGEAIVKSHFPSSS